MAKRKVIKFVFQRHDKVNSGEFFLTGKNLEEWVLNDHSDCLYDVYHRIETEEEVPRWRAENGCVYYGVTSYYKIVKSFEQNSPLDDMMYDSGNYFQTEQQAQEYIDHCKKFFENN